MKFTWADSQGRIKLKSNHWLWLLLLIFLIVWTSTLIGTSDLNNWLLENTLTFATMIFLIATFKKYQFSDISYMLIAIFLCLHVYGSKYTYAENPFGFWMMDSFQFERNHYDRLAHFGFGLLLTYPMREMFVKWMKLPQGLSVFLPIEITLSIGAMYELVEWAVAGIFFKAQGPAYLGTQGDDWDAQKDIFMAFSGAIIAAMIIWLFNVKRKATQ